MTPNRNAEPVFLSIVLYAYNNADIIIKSLKTIYDFTRKNFMQFELIILDDASTDSTITMIKEFAQTVENSKITLISLQYKHGTEKAISIGLDFSIGDFVIEMESPYINYDINMLYELFEKSAKGNDVVSLIPENKMELTSTLFYSVFKRFSDLPIDLNTESACILTRRAINKLSQIKDKTQYRKINYKLTGYSYSSISYQPKYSVPNLHTFSERWQSALDILFSFTNVGMKINMILSLIFLLVSLFVGGYAACIYLFYDEVMEGWTTIMLVLSFGFSGIFLVFSVLSKYFELILKEIRTLPDHTIKMIEKL